MPMIREKGYWNKIALVDLSKRTVKYLQLSESIYGKFIGGVGLGVKLLIDNTPPRVDPLSPENLLIFTIGPVEGLTTPSDARMCAVFKSPLTGFFGESFCGGYIGVELAKAGLDGFVVRGLSSNPVYLLIKDGVVEIKDASHLWGLDAYETEKELWRELGEIMTLTIGPAGENLVRYACIVHGLYMHEKKNFRGGFFGRTGGGAVMGSKKLKAIAIHGEYKVESTITENLNEFRSKVTKLAREKLQGLTKFGTSAIMSLTNTTGSLPTRYYEGGSFQGYEKVGPETFNKIYVKKKATCYFCPVACGRHSEISGETGVVGPEYETLFALGPLTYVDNLELIIKANNIANKLGMDTISAGNAVAFAMYLVEKGLLTDGWLKFGDGDAMLKMFEMIAYRRGLGDVLAEGVKRAAEILKAEKHAVHVKGLEFPGYDPRALKGVALAYGVSARGACHLRHVAYRPNLVGIHPFNPDVKVNRFSYDGHVEYVLELEDFYAIIDSLILCKFYALPVIGPLLWKEVAEIYYIATGKKVSPSDLRKNGEVINNLIRLYNIREGLKKEDDMLPERIFSEPLKFGGSSNEKVNRDDYLKMLEDYYRLRGWSIDGVPTSGKIRELDLLDYLDLIQR
ncbi:MAG: aldehyde ferredoxin oxidoreductase family protein [Aigarchaeota archaeon]|nr:aldehyde ferredoxin oxidoreductase family protein [Aigarchaeota archaeon]MDW7985783.1 aldehyde ferredoxin oxidoreductase family protein [Nitrososphaerota archaeon]